MSKKEIIPIKRKEPCIMCGEVDKEGNHIIGYDHTDMDKLLEAHYKKGDVLCSNCLFK